MIFKLRQSQINAYYEHIGVYKMEQTYRVNVKSRFMLTQTYIKAALGIGYQVLSVELEKDASIPPIINVDTAAQAIILTGYRALARAYHPDLGGDAEVMKTLNRTKKELLDLLQSIGGI
jgi:hypothetical protein